jgi:hypothetical protein
MDAKTLLSLDISTSCTGWSLFNLERELLVSGLIKPSTKGQVVKMTYPRQQLTKMRDISTQILNVILEYNPSIIVIEEITGSKNRMGQKTLDGCHFLVVDKIEAFLDRVYYYDVSGNQGWRYHLQLRLSDADKLANKEAKKLNKKLAASQRMPVVTPKHLACRHANARFNLALDCNLRETDGDLADSMCMADAFLTFRFAEIPK